MTEKKKPPPPPLPASGPPPSEDELKFGDELPVLPIRNAVLFPGAVAPFDVGREKSVALVEDVHNLDSPVIAIFAQRDPQRMIRPLTTCIRSAVLRACSRRSSTARATIR